MTDLGSRVKISIKELDHISGSMRPWFSEVWGRDEDVTHLDQLRFLVKIWYLYRNEGGLG